jgi:hypothetical protein
MTKKRKLHQLIGTINYCFSGQVTSQGPHHRQPFYCLTIQQESLFTSKKETSIYAFPNLVSPAIWKTLETETYQNKKYLFSCEKRTRGWRLKEWAEISPQN